VRFSCALHRAEGKVKSLDDIENIVVENGTPIYVKDVADVFGHANRFGAITGNGEARYLVK
jgi:cobalt-zinc-cadmium resistance protein CzcA